ncbi:MAG: hypothetical protein HY585_02265 [Candidatus Omnitrophica bacterium]|nr:hypothetical protein [Candidatus Omnitrophota bacterium]
MKKKPAIIGAALLAKLVIIGMLVFEPGASAETIQGVVIHVDSVLNYLLLARTDLMMTTAEELKIIIPPDTELRGIASLADLEVGDEIRVDAFKESGRTYEANTIEEIEPETSSERSKVAEGRVAQGRVIPSAPAEGR